MSKVITREKGRVAFGDDPDCYHAARPDYPDWVFDLLRRRCGLGVGTSVFEIGAGTGMATTPLLALGASPLVAIEPDQRLAAFLEEQSASPALRVVKQPFEDVDLGHASYDLGTSATAFHWLDEAEALQKIARALRPGGWWAPFWNIAGDPAREDPFHEATHALLSTAPASPSSSDPSSRLEFGADTTARLAALRATKAFDVVEYEQRHWTRELSADGIMRLYSTYSNVALRPDRDHVIAELGRIAEDVFGGRVTRNMITIIYLARRAS